MIGLLPILKVCPLVRETAASYIVSLGSGGRTTSFRKNTAGRRYFLSEAEAVR